MNVFFILFVLFPVAEPSYQIIDSGLDDLWEGFKTKFEKKYDTPIIEVQRRLIWERNFRHVIFHNREADKGMQTFWLGINEYADMNGHEFVAMKNGLKPRNLTSHKPKLTFVDTDVNDLPVEVDWRNEGYVTEVKNQGLCGACWAFSATGSLEGQHFKKTNDLISLSEQQLVDCCTDHDVNNAMTVSSSDFVVFGNNLDKPSACAICFEGNQGCSGGIMDSAFECIKDRGGIMSEIDYPYEAKNGHCDFDRSKVVAKCTGHVALKSGSEEALQKAVATVGPISAGIDAGHYTFILYSHGVYKSEDCSPRRLDHGVLVVGYGTEDGTDYWLVKNSWGKIWGMDGYVKMARNYKNMCGIATQASYPLV